MITEHFRQVPSFRCMQWADPEGGQRVRTPPPPPPPENLKIHRNIGFPSNIDPDPLKSQSYQASIQWWAIDTPAKRHFKGVSLMGRWWSILVEFRSSLTTPSDKMFWIHACMQCVWTGLIEIKLSTDIISWYFGTYNVRQRLRRACASLHSRVKHWWLWFDKHWWLWYDKHHCFYVEWINFVSHDSNHNLGKGPFVYKLSN